MKMKVKIAGQSFEVEVRDLHARPVQVLVDGEAFEVWVEEDGQVRANGRERPEQAGAQAAPVLVPPAPGAPASAAPEQVVNRTKAVLAPIPGVIISVNVKEGDSVAFGQELCVLEAMKMKNLIKANRAGKIASIAVAPGDQVRHSQVLMEFSD